MADAFDSILGQPKVRDFLRMSVKTNKVSHAYLFTGPAGSNKTLAAWAFAQALLCSKDTKESGVCGCAECDDCQRVMRKVHPDVHFYTPEGAGGYLVEQIREIVSDTSLAPIQAKLKVYILDRVDLLGTSAANAFLKTLEEPPDDVVLILMARTRESALPTIVSRCQVVPFRHIPAQEAAGIVSQNTGAPIDQARQAIEACGGSITRSIEFLSAPDNERVAFRTSVLNILSALSCADAWDVLMYARTLAESSQAPLDVVRATQESELAENADFLENSTLRRIEARNKRQLSAKTSEYLHQATSIIGSWLRDVLMICSGCPELIINSDVQEALKLASRSTSPERLSIGLRAVYRADEAIAYNVSPETCLDALLFEVREVVYGTGSTN